MENKNLHFIYIAAVLLALLAGAMIDRNYVDKSYNKSLSSIEEQYKSKILDIQYYDFNLSAYSKFQSQEPLRQPFACVLGDGEEMEKMFYEVFSVAGEGTPVCFVNKNVEPKEELALDGGFENESIQ